MMTESLYLKDLRVKYELIENYFKASSKKLEKLREFFNSLCREIFKKNLEIYDRAGITFPIIYGERCAYSSIGASLHDLGYAHMSEWGVKATPLDNETEDLRRRHVDFWVWNNKKSLWLEFKFLSFNLGGKVSFLEKEPKVLEGIEQIKEIPHKGAKIALYNIPLWLSDSKQMSVKELRDKRDKNIESFLKIQGIKKEKVLCGVLDFSECYKEYKFYQSKDRVPYMLIFGVIHT